MRTGSALQIAGLFFIVLSVSAGCGGGGASVPPPPTATHFSVMAPATATTGTPFNFTVTAEDALNNTVTGYTGTVHFTSSDSQAVLPANTTLTSGTGTFAVTLKTGGSQTITATETVNGAVTGSSSGITVSAPPSFSLSVSPSSLLTAQTTTSVPVTVTANPMNGFTGAVNVTIGGLPNGVNPSTNSTFTLAAGASQMVTFAVGPSVGRANYNVTFSGSSGTLSSLAAVTLTVSGAPLTAGTGNFKQQVIYQIVTDRFFDGDPSNDDPPQSKGLFDATCTNFQMYWGGDFAGIQQKMAYLAGMGITAIWISPPVDNINVAANLGGTSLAPFHGFWARDMKRTEEHFGDPSNSWTAFDSMVAAAHQN